MGNTCIITVVIIYQSKYNWLLLIHVSNMNRSFVSGWWNDHKFRL